MRRLINAKLALFLTILLFAILFLTQGEPYVRSDSWCYYTVSKNIIEHGNFVTKTEPEYWDYMEHLKEKKDDKYISVCSVGTPLIHLPGLFIADIFEGDKTTYNDYFKAYNGHTIYEGLAILITAYITAILSLILIYKTLRNLGYSERNSIASVSLAFGSSFAVWYIFLLPMFTHIYEIFCVSLILYLFVKLLKEENKTFKSSQNKYSWAWGIKNFKLLVSSYELLIGFVVGLSILVRPTLAPIGLCIFIYLLYKKHYKDILKFITGGIPLGLIWLLYNYISYDTFITSGYSSVRSENFNFSEFNGLNILFSPYRGLFTYSPVFVLGILGLILLLRKQKPVSIISLTGIFSAVLIYGFWPAWWGGGSYGSRFMMFSVPFFAIGLSEFIKYVRDKKNVYRKSAYLLLILLFIYSLDLTFLYRVTITSNLPEQYEGRKDGMYAADRYTPFLIYKFHFNLLKDFESPRSYAKSIYENINGGSGLLASITGVSNGVLRIDDNEENIKLWILTPPKMRRDLPKQVEGYYVNKSKIQSFKIQNIEDGDLLEFNCINECESLNEKIIFEAEILESLELSTNNSCFIIHDNDFLCFKRADNLQFRGLPLNIEVGQDTYQF